MNKPVLRIFDTKKPIIIKSNISNLAISLYFSKKSKNK